MPRTRSLRWSELKLGIVGVVAFVLATALVFAVGGQGGFFWQRYPLVVRFDDVGGLKAGAIVRLNGLEVGKVTRVEFAGAQVEVGLEISRSVRHLVTEGAQARMGTLSLLGEPIVELRAGTAGAPLPDGAEIPSVPGGGGAGLAETAGRSLEQAGGLIEDVRAGRGTVGRLFTDETLDRDVRVLVASTARLAEALDRGEGTLGALARDTAAYASLRASLASLEAITGALARGEGTAGRLIQDSTLHQRVDSLAARTDRVVALLEGGEGTAGRLLTDPALYQSAHEAVAELRALIADVRADPGKYLSVRLSVF